MTKRSPSRRPAGSAREPVQVYLIPDDVALLGRLVRETGLAKAEVLRRGIRSFAAEQRGQSPMLRFLADGGAGSWPADAAANHDAILADDYRARKKRR